MRCRKPIGDVTRAKVIKGGILEVAKKTYVEFAENSSFHGVKYTVQKDTTTAEKIFWFAIMLLGVVGSVFMVQLFWERYISNPTRSAIQTFHAPTTAIPFPGVTICNINRMMPSKITKFLNTLDLDGYKEEDVRRMFPSLLAYTIVHPYNLTELEILRRIFDKNDIRSVKKVFKRVGQSCKEMLVRCMWEGAQVNCHQLFIELLTIEGTCCSFNHNNRHYPINRTLYYGYQMGLSVLLNSMDEEEQHSSIKGHGMKVIMHNPEDYPGENNNAWLLAVARETLVQITGNTIKCSSSVMALAPVHRQCLLETEGHLSYFRHYSPFNCLTECRMNYILQTCKCIPFYYQTTEEHAVCNISKIPCLADDVVIQNDSTFDITHCKCLLLCEDNYFEILTSSARLASTHYAMSYFLSDVQLHSGSLLLHVYFNSQTQTVFMRNTITSTIYLLSSFGGILSLFLGFSFISLVEVIYYTFIRFAIYVRDVGRVVPKKTQMAQTMKVAMKVEKIVKETQVQHGEEDASETALYSIYGRNTFIN